MPNNKLAQQKLCDFQKSEKVDWLNHPNFGKFDPVIQLDDDIRKYTYTLNGSTQVISVDLSQNNGISLNKCAKNFFDSNFSEGDPLLLADNTTSTPIIITFDPPVLAIGSHISADGKNDEDFFGFQYSCLSKNGQWEEPLFIRGKINKVRNDAPFIGAKAQNGEKIHAVAFDVTFVTSAPLHVAINTLRYIPQ